MSTPGAAKRLPDDSEDPAALIAAHCARADATLDQLKGVLDMLSGGQCGRDTPLWLKDVGEHLWEYRQAVTEAAASFPAIDNAIEMGRALERAEQAARLPARHARHSRPARSHLRLAGVAAAAAVVATSGTVATMTDTGNTHHTFLPSPAAALHAVALPGDTATLIPQGSPVRSFSSPRPSVNAKSAAPVVTPSPSAPVVTASPPQPAPVATQVAPPALTVSAQDLQLTGTSGSFSLAATTETGTSWAAETDIPGATLSVTQGVLTSAQQPVTVTLTDPEGLMGTVFVKFDGGGVIAVRVWPSAQ